MNAGRRGVLRMSVKVGGDAEGPRSGGQPLQIEVEGEPGQES